MENPGLSSISGPMFDAEVLQAKLPVLVEFGAVWCAPCRMMEPHLRSLAEEHAGALVIRKVDVDSESELADRFDVRNLPTMLLFASAGLAAASGRAA